ncbi:hypothetical protein [Porphyrobacter sp. YT40]|uniref:hypothetical protein n=1 Tax=Porphyrobacter sp. YT40 TaxID=2547601 RepID=UPI001142689A|nr:hypothetical protein [Porphyrobacter sp. YT40]QDH35613.1 hypothetical protein E2E27_15610 [Porphyrobacter sp. YT40]
MFSPRSSALAALALALAAATGCKPAPAAPPPASEASLSPNPEPAETLGLMSSLPLYWPLGTGIEALAAGNVAAPWQRAALERGYRLEPLDTLSPIPGLAPDAPEVDPLAGLTRLAVIQPRGLSPLDNVALDEWVRAGGRLLLVLDPALTGEYDIPLGDPRRPADTALIPPVVARWGMAVRFDEAQQAAAGARRLGTATLPLAVAGEVVLDNPAAADCEVVAEGAAARCRVGAGHVTLIADAAVFEHPELAGPNADVLLALVREALR